MSSLTIQRVNGLCRTQYKYIAIQRNRNICMAHMQWSTVESTESGARNGCPQNVVQISTKWRTVAGK